MNKYLSLEEIKKEVNNKAKIIKVPSKKLPSYGISNDFGHPHIEVNESGYHYIGIERGQEIYRKTTTDLNIILYWIFESITNSMAYEYELNNRIEGKDSRRIAFAKQEELLGSINKEWEYIAKQNHFEILKENPFDDLAGLRASYCRELRNKGYSEKEIDEMIYKKYPMNNIN